MFKKLVTISLLLLVTMVANATHIVGGEIYYKLNNASTNSYTITVNVYIDCENGNAGAISDDATIFISMWDATTLSYIQDFTIRRSDPVRLNNTNYACIKEPKGVCVDAYAYTTTRTINPGTNGVILAWQRCCRNNSITNIVSPEASGFTAWTVIPPKGVTNSSAYFSTVPPVYVCTNAPLIFQQPAVDPDGDSLVYELNTPFLGATDKAPRPSLSSDYDIPPFKNLLWQPGYSVANMMAGSPKLSINSATGEINVTPNQIGQYVVGYKVKEYRNGVLIGETRRDYQFNVINCEFDVIANFTIPGGVDVNGAYAFECGDTVCFNDLSYSKLKPYTLSWDFGDPTTVSDTSHDFKPCYVYPGNGNFTVTLKVKSSICEDSYNYDVRIRSVKPFELGPDVTFCKDIDYRLDTKTPDAISVNWNTGQTGSRIIVKDSGLYIADVSYGKCSYKDSVQLLYDKVPPFSLSTDTLLCDTVNLVLDAGPSGPNYQWSTSSADIARTVRVTKPGIYSVVVFTNYCFAYDTIRVWTATKPGISNQFFCDQFTFDADPGSIEEGQYLWSTGATSQKITLVEDGVYWVRVSQRNCVHTDSFIIKNSPIELDLGKDKHFCDELNTVLDAGASGNTYTWNTGAVTRTIAVIDSGKFSVTVTDTFGCSKSDSIELSLSNSPTFWLGDDTTICINSPTLIKGPDGFKYEWNTGSTDAGLITQEEGLYFLKIIDEFGCEGYDSLYITVDPEALPNDLYVPNSFTPNADGTNDLFPYSIVVKQPAYYVTVFSRWGEKVFDSRDDASKPNWDGRYKGEPTPNQMYIYYMYYRGCDGNARTREGNVYPLH